VRPRQEALAKTEEARRLFLDGDYEGAVVALTEAIRLHPRSMVALSLRSQAFHWLHEESRAAADREAIAAIQRSTHPSVGERAVAKNKEGHRMLETGDLEGAGRAFTEAIASDPDYAEAYRNRAEVFRRLGDERDARVDFEEAMSIEKDLQSRKAAAEHARFMADSRAWRISRDGWGTPEGMTQPVLPWLVISLYSLILRAVQLLLSPASLLLRGLRFLARRT